MWVIAFYYLIWGRLKKYANTKNNSFEIEIAKKENKKENFVHQFTVPNNGEKFVVIDSVGVFFFLLFKSQVDRKLFLIKRKSGKNQKHPLYFTDASLDPKKIFILFYNLAFTFLSKNSLCTALCLAKISMIYWSCGINKFQTKKKEYVRKMMTVAR